jgi:hypothetical protein
MQLEDREACATDLAFDRWFAQEYTPARTARFEEHLQGCTRCRVRGELLERERAKFLANAPTLAANQTRLRQLRAISPGGRRFSVPRWLPFAVAAIAVFGLVPAIRSLTSDAANGGERSKGGFYVGFYVKHGEELRPGASGEVVQPGDQLRFTVSSKTPVYLALLGRDEHTASVYFPAASDAAHVAAGSEEPLDFSLELDPQLGTERLFAIACPTAFPVAPLRAALQAEHNLKVPADCQIERITLQKEQPR